MTSEQQQMVRELGQWFYGREPQVANEEVAGVLAEMLQETLAGSKMMDLVPRPTGGPPGLTWLVGQAVQMWWRSRRSDRVYETIKRTVALKYKSRYAMAEMGI